jgi:hypothetical protein
MSYYIRKGDRIVFDSIISESIRYNKKAERRVTLYRDDYWIYTIDIRDYYPSGSASKRGISLSPQDYVWMLKQFEKNKFTANNGSGIWSFRIKKCKDGVILTKVLLSAEELNYKLMDIEIKNLLELYPKFYFHLKTWIKNNFKEDSAEETDNEEEKPKIKVTK